MTNTRPVTIGEQRDFYKDELAKAIAAMFYSGELHDASNKLHEAIFKAMLTLTKNPRELQDELDRRLSDLHTLIRNPRELQGNLELVRGNLELEGQDLTGCDLHVAIAAPEDPSELIAARKLQLQDEGPQDEEPRFLLDVLLWEIIEVERIGAMTNFIDQAQAFTDWKATQDKQSITKMWILLQLEGKATPESKDFQRFIRNQYLDSAWAMELRELVKILLPDDIIKKGETHLQRLLRVRKEQLRKGKL